MDMKRKRNWLIGSILMLLLTLCLLFVRSSGEKISVNALDDEPEIQEEEQYLYDDYDDDINYHAEENTDEIPSWVDSSFNDGIPQEAVDLLSEYSEEMSSDNVDVFVYTDEEDDVYDDEETVFQDDEIDMDEDMFQTNEIQLFAAGARAAGYTTVKSGKNNVNGLVDYPNGSVNYIIAQNNICLSNATVEFQKWSNNAWVTDSNPPFTYVNTPTHYDMWDCKSLIHYNKAVGGDWGSSGKTFSNNRIKLTFPNAALGSDGQYHNIVLTLSNIYFKDDRNRTKDVAFIMDRYNSLEFTSSHECVDVFFDATFSVTGASSSDVLFMMFSDLDVGYYPTHTSPDWVYTGSFAGNNPIEAIKIKSGICPGTQPHVPNDCVLRIVDGEQPEYYATRATSDMDSYKAAVSYLANATGTTLRWSGQGCATFVGIDMGYMPSFTVKTQVRTELDSSSPTGTKTYGSWSEVHSRRFLNLMSATYSYTYSKATLMSAESLTSPSDDWIFNYSGTTVGESGITGNKVYSITINRNRYTYSFNANPPAGKTAANVSNMPGNKTITASKAASGKSDATVREPSLTGFWFKGWNTKADGTGTAYPGSETMKSDKTFYAQWQPATYTVHFNGNGSVNPNHQTGEFTQNTVTGTMTDQTLQFDSWENLKANAFSRTGYTFAGWNTKSDGTGTPYSDKQSVRNLIGYDKSEITLYAQWTKKLGTETITVVSEETGNPVTNVSMKLQKAVNGTWTDVTNGTTNTDGQIAVCNLHWFNYRWVMTNVPAGYVKSADTAFTITYNQLSATNSVILYMKHVSITVDSQVSDVIKGESPPRFIYRISGTDVAGTAHEYYLMVQINANSKFGTNRVPDLFAGTYTITQIPVSRYIPGTAVNISNGTINGIHASVDVKNNLSAEVKFPYTIREYGWYYGVNSKTNSLTR